MLEREKWQKALLHSAGLRHLLHSSSVVWSVLSLCGHDADYVTSNSLVSGGKNERNGLALPWVLIGITWLVENKLNYLAITSRPREKRNVAARTASMTYLTA